MISSSRARLRARGFAAGLCFVIWSCAESNVAPSAQGEGLSTEVGLPMAVDLHLLEPGVAQAVGARLEKVRESPAEAAPRFELGMVYDANSLYEAAQEAYSQTVQLDMEHGQAHYHSARMLRELGRLDESRLAIDRALELEPRYAPAHRRSAEWYLQSGDFDAAERGFTRVRELEPLWPDGILGLAHLALVRDDPQDAADMAREVIAAYPKSSYAQHLLGSALRDMGHPDEAEAAFALAAGGVPAWRDPWVDVVEARLSGHSLSMVAARTCLERGQFEEASERLAVLHARDPDDVTVQGMWTAALTGLERYDEALQMLMAARARQPEHFRIELNLAIVHRRRGDLDLSLEHVQRAIELHPGHPAVYMVQGRVLRDRQEAAKAITALEMALRLGEDPRRVIPRIGSLQVSLQRWADAAVTYERATQEMPEDASLQATLAGCLAEAGDHEGALAALSRARAIDPDHQLLSEVEARVAELKAGRRP
jgi:tetratricopeptide (TPR) repeat protein